MKLKTANGKIIQRDPRHEVGKRIGNAIYFHERYLDCFPFKDRIKKLLLLKPQDFKFNLIKYDYKQENISLLYSPDFNDSFTPILRTSLNISKEGKISRPRTYKANPPIYHHRWLFVKNDYQGFDVKTDFLFCKKWSNTPGLISNKYGFLNHWNQISIPKIVNFYRLTSIQEIFSLNKPKWRRLK